MSLADYEFVSPLGISYDDWASDLCDQLSSYNVPNPGPEDLWREWAAAVVSIDELSEGGFLNPYGFEDWRDWASALMLLWS